MSQKTIESTVEINASKSEQVEISQMETTTNLFNMFETMKDVLTKDRYKDKSIMKMKL